MSRPLKEINWELVEKRMEAGNTAKQLSAILGIDLDTFYRRFKDRYNKSYGDYGVSFYDAGDANILFTQYMKALAGNNHMLMLLGRERLGQGKEQEKESPFQDILELKHENMILKAEIRELKGIDDNQNDNQPQTGQEFQGSDTSL